jgi:hypothetical protein
LFTPSSNVVEWNQNGHDNGADRDEDDQESPQVSKEKVGVQTALFDDFAIAV